MRSAGQRWTGRLPALAGVALGALSLAACAGAPDRPALSVGGGAKPARPEGSSREPPASAWLDPDTGRPLRGTMKPYQVRGLWYVPRVQPDYDVVGTASWYGQQFHNRSTANGERFDMHAITAAHKTLPLPSLVEVTNLDTGRRATVRVNDRGPFVDDRILDLSRGAAEALGALQAGLARVRVRYLGPAPAQGGAAAVQVARAEPRSRPSGTERDREAGRYAVQAGAFGSRDNASRARDRLADAGTADVREQGRLYRVLLTGYREPNSAEQGRQRAVAAGFPDAQVVRDDRN